MVGRWELQIWVDEEWQSVGPDVPVSMQQVNLDLGPYRYEDREDAQTMLDKLYPDLPESRKRIVRV